MLRDNNESSCQSKKGVANLIDSEYTKFKDSIPNLKGDSKRDNISSREFESSGRFIISRESSQLVNSCQLEERKIFVGGLPYDIQESR